MPALRLALDHPVVAAALCLCLLAWAARAYFRYTRRFLERFDELPDRRFLSGPEQLVLGFPRELEPERLARLDARYRLLSRVAFLLALVVTVPLGLRAAVRAGEPRGERRERVADVLRELEVELAGRAAGEERGARVDQLATRLDSLVTGLVPADGVEPDAEDAELARRSRALLAVARGDHEAVLDLVSERELELEAQRTEQQIAREVELAVLRARAERGLGRPERAVDHYERALRLMPDRPELCFEAAETLFELGRPVDALPALERCVTQDARALANGRVDVEPRLAAARELRADALHEAGRNVDALAELDALVPLLRTLIERGQKGDRRLELAAALHGRGTVLEELGRADEALNAFDAAVSARRALAHDALERDALVRSLELAEALSDRARVAAALDEPRRALRDLDEVVGLREQALAQHDALELEAALAMSRAARGALRVELGARELALADLDAAIDALELLGPEVAPGDALGRARAARAMAVGGAGAEPVALAEAARAEPSPPEPGLDLPALPEAGEREDPGTAPPPEPAPVEELAPAPPAARPAADRPADDDRSNGQPDARVSPTRPVVAVEPEPAPDEPLERALARVSDHLDRAAERLELDAPEAALADGEAASDALDELTLAPREAALWRARAAQVRAEALLALDDADAAAELLEVAVRALDEQLDEPRADRELARELAAALDARGRLHARRARYERAEPDLDRAIELRRGLLADEAGVEGEAALARSLADRGLVAFNRHDPSRALRDLDEAVQLLAELVEHEGRADLRPVYERARTSRELVLGR